MRARVLSRLPATLTAEGGLAVNKANGIWTFAPDWSVLEQLTVLPEPESKSLWVLDDETDVYYRLSMQAVIDSLPDGPAGVDGALIYVQNSAPVTTGPEGSLWIDADSTDLDLYQLISEVWTDTGANLKGIAATVTAGTTTTLAEGASATAANSGTTAAAIIDFGIPRGAIPAIGFNFSTTTTDSDPGAGIVRFNNATPASVTEIYFDNADRDGNTVTTWLDSWDDSTNTAKGTLSFTAAATPSTKLVFAVTGSIVDGTGYRKVTVTHVAGATLPSAAAHLGVTFSRAGDKGTDGTVAVSGTPSADEFAQWTSATTIRGRAAADVRTDLGLVIGTNVQAYDAALHSNLPQNSKSAAYTTVLTDANGHIFHPAADTTARIWTIDSNANVAYPLGTTLTFAGEALSGVITLSITSDTLVWVPSGSTGSRTLTAPFLATAVKVTTTKWFLSGVGIA